MANTYKNYNDFVKRELKAVPLGAAQPQNYLTAVLQFRNKHTESPRFDRFGNLSSLCASTDYRNQIKQELANLDTLEDPFKKDTNQDTFYGRWNTKNAGLLGCVVPNTAKFGAWLGSYSTVTYAAFGLSTYYIKDEYLLDIILTRKWKPSIDSLKDFYVINEIILATKISLQLDKGVQGGVGATLDIADINVANATNIGVNFSLQGDTNIVISGIEEHGETKPFPIAFRSAHITYKDDFTLKKPMRLGVRRGEHDGLHISGFVAKDEQYHIGEFFFNTVEDDDEGSDNEGSDNEGSDDDTSGPEVVPIVFDQAISEPVAQK